MVTLRAVSVGEGGTVVGAPAAAVGATAPCAAAGAPAVAVAVAAGNKGAPAAAAAIAAASSGSASSSSSPESSSSSDAGAHRSTFPMSNDAGADETAGCGRRTRAAAAGGGPRCRTPRLPLPGPSADESVSAEPNAESPTSPAHTTGRLRPGPPPRVWANGVAGSVVLCTSAPPPVGPVDSRPTASQTPTHSPLPAPPPLPPSRRAAEVEAGVGAERGDHPDGDRRRRAEPSASLSTDDRPPSSPRPPPPPLPPLLLPPPPDTPVRPCNGDLGANTGADEHSRAVR